MACAGPSARKRRSGTNARLRAGPRRETTLAWTRRTCCRIGTRCARYFFQAAERQQRTCPIFEGQQQEAPRRGEAEVRLSVCAQPASQPTRADLGAPSAFRVAANHETTSPRRSLITKLRSGSDSASRCCARRASARVAYVPFSSSPSYTLYGARGSSSSMTSYGRKLVTA